MVSSIDNLSPPRLPACRDYFGSVAIGLVCACLALTVGCDKPWLHSPGDIAGGEGDRAGADDGDNLAESSDAIRFDRLFKMNCAGCHGADGQLGPAPPLNDPIFLAIVSDEQLLHAIQNGRRGTPMPSFSKVAGGLLTPVQVQQLAVGIKRRWKPAENLPDNLPTYAVAQNNIAQEAVALRTSESAAAGAKVFARACAECHGADGRGQPDDVQPRAIRDSNFLALISNQALRRIIITGRPDLGMPDFADKHGRPADFQPLTSQDIINLVALLASWRTEEPEIVSDPTWK